MDHSRYAEMVHIYTRNADFLLAFSHEGFRFDFSQFQLMCRRYGIGDIPLLASYMCGTVSPY